MSWLFGSGSGSGQSDSDPSSEDCWSHEQHNPYLHSDVEVSESEDEVVSAAVGLPTLTHTVMFK